MDYRDVARGMKKVELDDTKCKMKIFGGIFLWIFLGICGFGWVGFGLFVVILFRAVYVYYELRKDSDRTETDVRK